MQPYFLLWRNGLSSLPSKANQIRGTPTMSSPTVKILRMRAVVAKLGVARSTIYDWLNPKSPRYDATFPKQLRLGQQSVGWMEAELDQWLLQRATPTI